MEGLWIENQGIPRIIGNYPVLWVTGPENKGEPYTVSISIGASLFLIWMLLFWANSMSMKFPPAPESSIAEQGISLLSTISFIGMIKLVDKEFTLSAS